MSPPERAPDVPAVQIIGVTGLPEVQPGDDLGDLLLAALDRQGTPLRDGDILVVTQKVVSKAEGRLVRLAEVEPSPFACAYAAQFGKDPRQVEVVLSQTQRIVRMDRGVLICETWHGLVCANAGVDASNAGHSGTVVLLPQDPDASARRLRERCRAAGADVAVIVSDTFGRPWRTGQTNVAIGAAGIAALRSYHGQRDPQGYVLRATSMAVLDELAGAAELVMGKTDRVPAAVIRGYPYLRPEGEDLGSRPLLRQPERDLFR